MEDFNEIYDLGVRHGQMTALLEMNIKISEAVSSDDPLLEITCAISQMLCDIQKEV